MGGKFHEIGLSRRIPKQVASCLQILMQGMLFIIKGNHFSQCLPSQLGAWGEVLVIDQVEGLGSQQVFDGQYLKSIVEGLVQLQGRAFPQAQVVLLQT